MEQTYFAKIKRAAKSECMNRRKIRLIILIVTVAAAMFELGEYQVYSIGLTSYPDNVIPRYADFSGYFGIFLMFTAAFFGAFAVYGVFSDLTSKQTADVQLSLPMSAKDRYVSKILALVKIHILPLVIAGAVVTLLGNLIHNSFDKIGYLLRFHAIVLAVALFVDAVCVFCMCCCGAKAEGVYTSLITGLCVSFTPYLFYMLAVLEFSGLKVDTFSFTKFFSLFGLMGFMWIPESTVELSVQPWLFLIGNMTMSCLLILVNFFIYRRRDGRQVGKPMVYTLFMELFMFIGLFTLFTIFFYTGSWGIGMTIAVIIYLIIRIVSARAKITPKLFAGWVGKYVVSLAVFTVIMGAAYFTGGFGYYKVRQTKIDTDTVNFDVDITEYRKVQGNLYGTGVRSERFDNIYVIDPDNIRDFDYYYYDSYHRVNNADEVKAKLDEINRIIDERYTLDDRNMDGFVQMMLDGSIRNKYVYNHPGVCVEISIWNENTVEVTKGLNAENRYSYGVEFWLPEEDYIEICTEFESILTRTDTYKDTYNIDRYGNILE